MSDIVLLFKLVKMMKTFKKIEDNFMQQNGEKFNLSGPQMEMLWLTYFHKDSTVSELSNLGLWHISTAMHLLQVLDKHELVSQVRDASDKRTTRVLITEKGSSVIEQMLFDLNRNSPLITAFKKASEESKHEISTFIDFGLKLSKSIYGESYVSSIENTSKKLEEALDTLDIKRNI